MTFYTCMGRCCLLPQRVVLAIMGFLALVNAYTMRQVITVAITVMVKKRAKNVTHSSDSCGVHDLVPQIGNDKGGDNFDWDETTQGWILAGFYYGYVVTHVPGGILADMFGGKWTLSLGILSTAIFTLATPLCAQYGGATALFVLRVCMGLGEGTTFPAMSALLSSWVPKSERGKIGCFVFGGGQFGSILGSSISGVMLHNIKGWSSPFYLFGAVGCLWFLIFTFTCYNTPDTHPYIGEKEKAYLQAELGHLNKGKKDPFPVLAVLMSLPMYGLIAAQIGHDWGFYAMITDLPKYMSDVLLYSVSNNGLLNALSSACMWVVSISTGFLGDYLIQKGYLSITNSRKMFTALAAVPPAFFCVGAVYVGCNRVAAVAMFTMSMAFMGMFYPGMKLTPLDLSPNYAGTIMAITNGIGALAGCAVPVVIAKLIPNHSLTEWRTVMWINFAIFISTTILYTAWASGEVQLWNDPTAWRAARQAKKDAKKAAAIKDEPGKK